MKRLCIYLIYDRQNMIDAYIDYMLSELKSCADHLVVVCNMTEIFCGLEILNRHADEIFYRENTGFDAGGFKEALCSYVGWEKVLEYDELILVNDSLFGPFKPMESIFKDMDERRVDFWGLATHASNGTDILEHVQTYFLVVRSEMLHCIQFKNYWKDMPFYLNFSEVVRQHEVKFTPYFRSLGYSYDVLADIKANDSKVNLSNNYMQYALISYELLKKRNFPFLKKQQLAYNTLSQQTQENLYQAIDYIDKETNYDVNLIWSNIIRTLNMADLQRSLCLQYIISSEKKGLITKRNIAIIVFVKHRDAVEYVLEYLNRLGDDFCVRIISENGKILESYIKGMTEKNDFLLERSCDLTELCQYDYVCILHDTDMSSDMAPSCTGKSYFFCNWENLFKDENHILGILEKFEKEERLGFLAPPQPGFADYFGKLGSEWDDKYERIEQIVKRLQLHCPVSEDKPPFRITDNFWVRGNILKCVDGLKAEEYTCLPYLWSYFAQHLGYYSGIVESMEYASMNEVNMQYYLKRISTQIKSEIGDFDSFEEMQEKIALLPLKKYCEEHSNILVYGTGYYAEKYKNILKNVKGYVVSDGHKKMGWFNGFPVSYLSEFGSFDGYGLVLCLDKKNQAQIIPTLKKRGITDYFCVY